MKEAPHLSHVKNRTIAGVSYAAKVGPCPRARPRLRPAALGQLRRMFSGRTSGQGQGVTPGFQVGAGDVAGREDAHPGRNARPGGLVSGRLAIQFAAGESFAAAIDCEYCMVGRVQDWPPRHERCEDPAYAKEKGLKLDLEYYLMNQVRVPCHALSAEYHRAAVGSDFLAMLSVWYVCTMNVGPD